jgi:hypothetical protein
LGLPRCPFPPIPILRSQPRISCQNSFAGDEECRSDYPALKMGERKVERKALKVVAKAVAKMCEKVG